MDIWIKNNYINIIYIIYTYIKVYIESIYIDNIDIIKYLKIYF